MESGVKPEQIAAWMLEELDRVKFLYQETAVYQIAKEFGDEFTYINDNGNLAPTRCTDRFPQGVW